MVSLILPFGFPKQVCCGRGRGRHGRFNRFSHSQPFSPVGRTRAGLAKSRPWFCLALGTMPVVNIGSNDPPNGGPPTSTSQGTADSNAKQTSDEMTVDLSQTGWEGRIQELKSASLALRQHRQKVAKDLKAAQRKNKRLKERARCLSEEDMIQILVMKRGKSGGASSSASSAASGSSTALSSGSGSSMPSGSCGPAVPLEPMAEDGDESRPE